MDGEGNGAANLVIGNGLANHLVGGAGNDTLTGLDGSDTLEGGLGNDVYIVTFGDQIMESAGGGIDSVSSVTTWTLAAQVENLALTGVSNVDGQGNAMPNKLNGNSGDNSLLGLGGADSLLGGAGDDTLVGGLGNDTLIGGAGSDVFVFDARINEASNVDTIVGFDEGSDKFQLDVDVFSGLTAGSPLNDLQMLIGAGFTTAQTAEQRIVYNASTGDLYYDPDGIGGVAAVKFATVGAATHPTLSAGDFVIVV